MSEKDNASSKNLQKTRTFKRFSSIDLKKSTSGIVVLKHGSSNNFHRHKNTLTEAAIREFEFLGLLIEEGCYYEPEFEIPTTMKGLSPKQQELMEIEYLKKQISLVNEMKRNRPKLHGMIMQHLSAESKDGIKGETDYEEWHKRKYPEKL